MLERIEWEGKVLALILRHSFGQDGVNFVTSVDNPLQLGVLKHARNAVVRPHVHRRTPKCIDSIQEVLHIEYGTVQVDFYTEGGGKVGSRELKPGDTILLLSGGHGFRILEDSRIIEVKQGPYRGPEEDKLYIEKDV